LSRQERRSGGNGVDSRQCQRRVAAFPKSSSWAALRAGRISGPAGAWFARLSRQEPRSGGNGVDSRQCQRRVAAFPMSSSW